VPLLLAPLVVLAILVSWLRALLQSSRLKALSSKGSTQANPEELHSTNNPLQQQKHPQQSAFAQAAAPGPLPQVQLLVAAGSLSECRPRACSWESVVDEEGDRFFLHRASGATAWERPQWLLALDHHASEVFYVDPASGASRWDRPGASGYKGADEGGWETVWDVAEARPFRWHAGSGTAEWHQEA
jgi:hypothetical protein